MEFLQLKKQRIRKAEEIEDKCIEYQKKQQILQQQKEEEQNKIIRIIRLSQNMMNDQNIKLKLQKLIYHIKQKEQKRQQQFFNNNNNQTKSVIKTKKKSEQKELQVGVNDAKIGQTAYACKVILVMRKPQ